VVLQEKVGGVALGDERQSVPTLKAASSAPPE
jgi:hypothetical protein